MRFLLPSLFFLARHFFWVFCAILIGCALWTVTFLVLILIAAITNQGVGGLLSFPAGILAIILACSVIGWGIFTPASALGLIFCKSLKCNLLYAIPLVFLSAFGLSCFWFWLIVHAGTSVPLPPWSSLLYKFSIFLALPLGVYWWITEGPLVLLQITRSWTQRLSLKHQPSPTSPSIPSHSPPDADSPGKIR